MNNEKGFILSLSFFAFLLYVARSITVAHILNNEVFEDDRSNRYDFNRASWPLLDFTLIACMFGGAAAFFAIFHVTKWTEASQMTALGLATLSLFAEFVAFGHACKQWEMETDDMDSDTLNGRPQFLGVSSVVQLVTQFVLVIVLWNMAPAQVESTANTDNALEVAPVPVEKEESETEAHP